jgi:S-disulfanyl-L-cysteine oxidoreductase SoxD
MSKLVKASQFLGVLFFLSMPLTLLKAAQTSKFDGIGRDATTAEVLAWDIDVRPDFKGLPKGSGTVAQGQEIWEGRCASCHGTFGESNEVFTPIIGGTTTDDIKNGRVASLADRKQPQRTTLMKVATVSSLWDYIYRAMPWNAPRSMSVDETFAVLAYLLNLAEIVPDDYVLSNENIAQVQSRMPNRDGMTLQHGLWSVKGVPDTHATACMNNCVQTVQITSTLPDYARNANGNIALQNREYGPYRGIDSTKPPLTNLPGTNMLKVANLTDNQGKKSSEDLFKANNCSACHANNSKLVGPSLSEISKKYQGQSDAQKYLVNKVRMGGAGVWGNIPMPAHPNISNETLNEIVAWILKTKS